MRVPEASSRAKIKRTVRQISEIEEESKMTRETAITRVKIRLHQMFEKKAAVKLLGVLALGVMLAAAVNFSSASGEVNYGQAQEIADLLQMETGFIAATRSEAKVVNYGQAQEIADLLQMETGFTAGTRSEAKVVNYGQAQEVADLLQMETGFTAGTRSEAKVVNYGQAQEIADLLQMETGFTAGTRSD